MDTARPLRIVAEDGAGVVGRARHIVASAWLGPVATPMVERARAALREVAAEHPGKAAYVNIIGPHVPAPPAEARAAFAAMIKESGRRICCAVIISEADGFQGAIVRSVTAGILLLARPAFPMSVCSGIADAERWMTKAVGPAMGATYVPGVIDVAKRTRAALRGLT